MKRVLPLTISFILYTLGQLCAQGWVSGGGNDIRALDGTGVVNPNLKVGIGTNAPTAQFHTTGPLLRHENLPKDTLDSVLVINGDGYVRWMSLTEWVIINNIGQGGGGGTGDDDWQVATGSALPMDINDKIFTYGAIGIGKNSLYGSVSIDALNPISTDEHFMISGVPMLVATQNLTNTQVGRNAGNFTMTGTQNTFVGLGAGSATTSGGKNVFVGEGSGAINTTGEFNNFVGRLAGANNTTGRVNNFYGNGAGYHNVSGDENCAFGSLAGFHNENGDLNTNIGTTAGYSNITGSKNTSLGKNAAYENVSGSENVILGFATGQKNQGNANTMVGAEAGYYNVGGEGNVFLGYHAGRGETGSNKLYIENSNVVRPLIYGEFDNDRVAINDNSFGTPQQTFWVNGSAGGTGAWNNLSDERVKKNFEPITGALDKLKSLNGYSYDFRVGEIESLKLPEGRKLGIKAQEVEKVFPEAISKGGEYMLVNYDALIPVLIEGVKELAIAQEENEVLKEEIDNLENRLAALEQLMAASNASATQASDANSFGATGGMDQPLLMQNTPNPFNEATNIRYFIPENSSEAQIEITGISGTQQAVFQNLGTGWGEVTVPASQLMSGTYLYTLTVNGKQVASKKMIVQ